MLSVKPAHLRAAQEIVELDLADGGVGLEIWKLVSQQESGHGGFLFLQLRHDTDEDGALACVCRAFNGSM